MPAGSGNAPNRGRTLSGKSGRTSAPGTRLSVSPTVASGQGGNGKAGRSPSPNLRRRQPARDSIRRLCRSEEEEAGRQVEVTAEDRLSAFLKDTLQDCSRQRLRALNMALRRYAVTGPRIPQKDMLQAFQDTGVKLPSRLVQMICDLFEDSQGIHFEQLFKCLQKAHDMTDRDSVVARRCRNDLEARPEKTKEEHVTDLLQRLETMLVEDKAYFDIQALRLECQRRDADRQGKLPRPVLEHVTEEVKLPLHGSLFKSLVRTCDEEKNDQISWPEFVSYLERAQDAAWRRDPSLQVALEKRRMTLQTHLASDPIMELSAGARSRVVSSLLKKASLQREKTRMSQKSVEEGGTEAAKRENTANQHHHAKNKAEEKKEVAKVPTGILSSLRRKISAKTRPTAIKEEPQAAQHETKPNKTAQKNGHAPKPRSEQPAITVHSPQESPHHGNQSQGKGSSEQSKPEPQKKLTSPPDPDMLTLKVKGGEVMVAKPKGYQVPDVPTDPPGERLSLDFVYGYRGNDCRKNMAVLGTGELVFFISNTAVLLSRETGRQRHYRQHTAPIRSMAVHSNGLMVATGQYLCRHDPSQQAHIRVWRSDLLQTMHVLGEGMFHKAVMCLTFAPNQDLLVAIDNSSQKKLSAWNTSEGKFLGESTIETDVICDADVNPKYPDLLVTSGREYLAWWRLSATSAPSHGQKPIYDTHLRARFVICVTHTDKGDLVTGDSNGTVYVWGDGGNRITNLVKHGHDGPVFTALLVGHHLVTGGRDGALKAWEWTKNATPAGHLQLPENEGGVRMIVALQGEIILGTTVNSLLTLVYNRKGSPLEGAVLDPLPITQGHFDDLRGLCSIRASPLGADVITAGLDGIVCKFSTKTRQPVWKIFMKGYSFLCVDASPDGSKLALGTRDGHVVILDKGEDEVVIESLNQKVTKERLDCVKLSPDCQTVVAGGVDAAIYVFTLQRQQDSGQLAWTLSGVAKGHAAPVLALDWSAVKVKDTYILRSCSSLPEQRFWNPDTCEAVEAKSLELGNLAWYSHNCMLDHSLTGLWQSKQAQDAAILCADVSPDRRLVVMGDSSGDISVFRYPCSKPEMYSHTYRMYGSVHQLRFSPCGGFVLAVGGRDSCLCQWKLV